MRSAALLLRGTSNGLVPGGSVPVLEINAKAEECSEKSSA